MSIRNLTEENNYKLYVNTAETGINIDQTQVKSTEQEGNKEYELILPPLVDYSAPFGNIGVITGTRSETEDKITLNWLSTIPEGVVPDPLNVNNIVVSNTASVGSTLDVLGDTTLGNVIVSGETEIQTNLTVGGNTNVRTLRVYNETDDNYTALEYNGTADVTYKLPETAPPDADPHVIVANNLNQMIWQKYNGPTTIGSKGYYINKQIARTLEGLQDYWGIGTDTFNELTPLEINKFYLVKIIYKDVRKTSGATGQQTWTWTSKLFYTSPLSGFQVIGDSSGEQEGFINYQSEGKNLTYTFDYLVRTTTANPAFEFRIKSNANSNNAKMYVSQATIYVIPTSDIEFKS